MNVAIDRQLNYHYPPGLQACVKVEWARPLLLIYNLSRSRLNMCNNLLVQQMVIRRQSQALHSRIWILTLYTPEGLSWQDGLKLLSDFLCFSEHASTTLETGTTIDRTHPPIILRLQRGPTIVRTSIGPTRRRYISDHVVSAALCE